MFLGILTDLEAEFRILPRDHFDRSHQCASPYWPPFFDPKHGFRDTGRQSFEKRKNNFAPPMKTMKIKFNFQNYIFYS